MQSSHGLKASQSIWRPVPFPVSIPSPSSTAALWLRPRRLHAGSARLARAPSSPSDDQSASRPPSRIPRTCARLVLPVPGQPSASHRLSREPSLAPARKSRHSARVRESIVSGALELRILIDSPWTAISTQPPLSHNLYHVGSSDSGRTVPPNWAGP